ncbi:MAG: hypothetical protein LLG06_14970 [Desulfobacteraceae bacterium]|nr:hypothetical protein [Desulfobacteraceae bacterium]
MMRLFSPRPLIGIPCVMLALCCLTGCIASQLKGKTDRPIESDLQIYTQSSIGSHLMDVFGLFPFSSPPEFESTTPEITAAFQARILQLRPFREVKILPYAVKSSSEALWYGRNEGCDLVMMPEVLYRMDGTGNLPTTLVVRVRIFDARTGKLLWDIKQKALSEPGHDIDLTWNTIAGAPAQRARELADELAYKFAEYLIEPLLKAKQEEAPSPPPAIHGQ